MSAQARANVHLARKNKLRGLPFFDDLPEVRCHRAIVISKLLIKGPLGLCRRLPSGLFALGGFGLVFLYFGLKISHHWQHSPQHAQPSIVPWMCFRSERWPR